MTNEAAVADQMLTTRRLRLTKIAAGRYAVDGTGLLIEKGDAPRFGERQQWDVTIDDDFLFTAKGKDACLCVIEAIAAEIERLTP